MDHEKVLRFTFSGRSFEVRAVPVEDRWQVRAYEKGKPITSVTYSVSFDTDWAGEMSGVGNLLENLMDLAQYDVEHGLVRLLTDLPDRRPPLI